MGKGDRKSKRGKIRLGSSGVSRPRKKSSVAQVPAASKEKPAEAKAEKPKTAKKTTAKKKEAEA